MQCLFELISVSSSLKKHLNCASSILCIKHLHETLLNCRECYFTHAYDFVLFIVDDSKPKESKLKGVKTMPNFQNIHSADAPKIHQSSTQATSLKRNESSGTDLGGIHKDSSSMKVS